MLRCRKKFDILHAYLIHELIYETLDKTGINQKNFSQILLLFHSGNTAFSAHDEEILLKSIVQSLFFFHGALRSKMNCYKLQTYAYNHSNLLSTF